jgi:hypothetical protein
MAATKQQQTTTTPFWQQAQSLSCADEQRMRNNEITKAQYFVVLNGIKAKAKGKVFERDYSTDPGDNIHAIHSFMTPDFYWYLSCDEHYTFIISYAINNALFEDELNNLITSLPQVAPIQEVLMEPDIATTFKRYKRLQNDKYFTTL